MSQVVAEKAAMIISPLIESEGYALYDVVYIVEQGQNILRVMIEVPHSEGVKLDDCVKVSRLIEDVLEVKAVVPSKYVLEVSSPGLNRPLRFKKHFEKVVGKVIKVKTNEAINGRRNFKGVLKDIVDNTLNILIDGMNFEVGIENILKANLEIEF